VKIRFFLGAKPDQVAGGIKQIYRQVDVLESLGYDAAVMVPDMLHRPVWFENSTRLVNAGSETLEKGDFLVVGELIPGIPDVPGVADAALVVYAQNPYGLLSGFKKDLLGILSMYKNKVRAVMCVSSHSEEVLSWLLKTEVVRVRYSFDREPFGYAKKKGRVLSYMPRKSHLEVRLAMMLLNAKGVVTSEGWEVREIQGLNEVQVAQALKDTSIFLCGSTREGFGMPPAEAMACGCVVVGFAGAAGVEFMHPRGCGIMIPQGDYMGMARVTANVMGYGDSMREWMGQQASSFICSEYSTEKEIESISKAWERVIG